MKKLTTLLLAAGMVVSSFAGASAGEFKPSAQFINKFTWGTAGDNTLGSYNGNVSNFDSFYARTRIQLGFDYIASENVSGTFLFRVQENYGDGEFDSQWNNNSFRVRLAYIDWTVPNTNVSVRMGYQPVALPAFAFGSAVLDGRGSGITINAPINDNIAISALWTRFSDEINDNDGYGDIFALTADFNFDGFRVAPWVAYADAGRSVTGAGDIVWGSNYKTSMWLVGASFELSMFDPFTFALDAYYSNVKQDAVVSSGDRDADGYFIGASFAYKTDFATPAFKAWYASGAKNKANGDDFIGAAFFAPCFGATSIMFDNYAMFDNYNELANGASPSGLWGLLLEVADISFVENLTHKFVVAYMEGTNEYGANSNVGSSLNYLGKDDSVVEINFDTTYQIYKNLSTTLQLGWLIPNFEYANSGNDFNDDILAASVSFVYKF